MVDGCDHYGHSHREWNFPGPRRYGQGRGIAGHGIRGVGVWRSAVAVRRLNLRGIVGGSARSRRRIRVPYGCLRAFFRLPLRVDANLGGKKRIDRGARYGFLLLSGGLSARTAGTLVCRAVADRAGRRAARNSIRATVGDLPNPAFVGRELSRCPGWRSRAGGSHRIESSTDRRSDRCRIVFAAGPRPQSLHFYDAHTRWSRRILCGAGRRSVGLRRME